MKRLLLLLRRWHRWLGLVVTLPVLLLVVTGVLLNHSDALALGKRPMPAWLAGAYGVQLPDTFPGVARQGHWLAQAGERLYRVGDNGTAEVLADCDGQFHGQVSFGVSTVLACGQQLVVLDEDGAVREQLGPAWGVPAFSAVGRHGDDLVLVTDAGPETFSLTTLTAAPLATGTDWQPASSATVPGPLAKALRPLAMPPSLHWQRLLQDAHSGRLFGRAGERVMDLAGVILVLLAFTGITMWWRVARRSPVSRRRQ